MRERKPIDPALRSFLDAQAAAAGPMPTSDAELVSARRMLIVRALESRSSIPGLPNKVEARDIAISGVLSGRLYTPAHSAEKLPVLVYLHGGGWVAGSIATHDPFCRLLSEAADVIIALGRVPAGAGASSPAALEDALAAVRWAANDAAQWGGDAGRLALGGDSSGGHLAAVTANRLSATPEGPALRGLLLLYPVTDHPDANHLSYTENATGYGLEAKLMRWFWEQYAPGSSPDDPNVSPLRLHKVPLLPPTLVATAEYDVLRDDGIAYAEKLGEAGVAVTHLHAPDMHHNFPVHPATVARFPQSNAALTQIAAWLRATLAATT